MSLSITFPGSTSQIFLSPLKIAKIKNLVKYFEYDEIYCIKKRTISFDSFPNWTTDGVFIKNFLQNGFEQPNIERLQLDPLLGHIIQADPSLAYYACLRIKPQLLNRDPSANTVGVVPVFDEEILLINWLDHCKKSGPANRRQTYPTHFETALNESLAKIRSGYFTLVALPYIKLLLRHNNIISVRGHTWGLGSEYPQSTAESLFLKSLITPADKKVVDYLIDFRGFDGLIRPMEPMIYNISNTHVISDTPVGVRQTPDAFTPYTFDLTGLRGQNSGPELNKLEKFSATSLSRHFTRSKHFSANAIRVTLIQFKLDSIVFKNNELTSNLNYVHGPTFKCLTTLGKIYDFNADSLFYVYFYLYFYNSLPVNRDLAPEVEFSCMLAYINRQESDIAMGDVKQLRIAQCFINGLGITRPQTFASLAFPDRNHSLETTAANLYDESVIKLSDFKSTQLDITFELKYVFQLDMDFFVEFMSITTNTSPPLKFLLLNFQFCIKKLKTVWLRSKNTSCGIKIKYLNNNQIYLPNNTNPAYMGLANVIYKIMGSNYRTDVVSLVPGENDNISTLKDDSYYNANNINYGDRFQYSSVLFDDSPTSQKKALVEFEFSTPVESKIIKENISFELGI